MHVTEKYQFYCLLITQLYFFSFSKYVYSYVYKEQRIFFEIQKFFFFKK